MDLSRITDQVVQVSETYAKKCQINRDKDWYLLKIQEELGELTQQHLKLSNRGRVSESRDNHQTLLENELADVFAHILLYANKNEIDLIDALKRKWFSWLD